jgi:hypothetical protein
LVDLLVDKSPEITFRRLGWIAFAAVVCGMLVGGWLDSPPAIGAGFMVFGLLQGARSAMLIVNHGDIARRIRGPGASPGPLALTSWVLPLIRPSARAAVGGTLGAIVLAEGVLAVVVGIALMLRLAT